MKFYSFLFIVFSMIACNSSQKLTKDIPREMQNIPCPEDGNCSFEVIKDSHLEIKTDQLGKIYPEIQKGENFVIKYHFEKKQPKDVEDASYSEFVYFEIDKNEKQLILKDKALQNVKMLYGRICFCRNATGYFRVSQGTLYFYRKQKEMQFNLNFEVSKVPQIITKINETIKY